MSDIASVADEPLTRAQIHMGEPEGEPLLDAVDLVAGYIPGVNILNGASLTLHEGEIVGIIGPNGAGKSTLLKSLFGLVHIHSGKLLLKGEDITNLRADKLVSRGVGFVPQTENVFPSLTIAENLHMGAFQAPKLFNERFDYVCSIFPKLGQRKNQLAGQLSGGERQMVAMARALMMKHPSSCSTSPPQACPQCSRTRPSSACAKSTKPAYPWSSSNRTPAAACRSATAATSSTKAATPTPARAAT